MRESMTTEGKAIAIIKSSKIKREKMTKKNK